MKITLLASSGNISDVLDRFVSKFFDKAELHLLTDSSYLAAKFSIRELKEMNTFLAAAFNIVGFSTPYRNRKSSLSDWITAIVSAARELVNASEAIAVQPVETSGSDLTSGLVISFGKTLEFLPRKTVTRRTWKDAHAQKFINAFNRNCFVKAFDKDLRYGGKQIGWCRLLCAPYKERLCDMPEEDLLAEGGMCATRGEFIQKYFDSNPRLEVWVIRFEFISDLALAISSPTQSEVELAPFVEPCPKYTPSEVECPECRADELFIAQNNLCNVIRCRACNYAVPKTYLGPIKLFAAIADQAANSPCPSCGFVHGLHENTLCDYPNPSPKVEVLNPEVYAISIINTAGNFSEERVSRVPPYLLDRKGNLLKKFWHRNFDAGYAEIVSEHLSHIARDSGLVVKLMTENLEVSQACIAGDPPPFLIHGGGVYKRDRVKLSLAPRYFQVVSEYLSNTVVV